MVVIFVQKKMSRRLGRMTKMKMMSCPSDGIHAIVPAAREGVGQHHVVGKGIAKNHLPVLKMGPETNL